MSFHTKQLHEQRTGDINPRYIDSVELTPSQKIAIDVAEKYVNETQNERSELIEHARRTADLVHVFIGEDMPSKAVDAALLHDIGDRVNGGDAKKKGPASVALVNYLTDPSIQEEEALYVVSILKDMVTIEDSATQYREDDEHKIGLNENDPDFWSKQTPSIPLDAMFEISQNTNIESVLIKSCEILDNLRYPAKTDLATMHDILEAESFYAPFCEILGYDGLAMEIRSYATQIRMIKQGEGELVKNANRFCHEMRKLGPESALSLFVDSEEDFEIYDVVKESQYVDKNSPGLNEHVALGEFVLDVEDDVIVKGNWRIKSVGSLVKKITKKYEADNERGGSSDLIPMDVVGMTVISDDTEMVARDFAVMADRLVRSQTMRPKPAPSKERAFIVQGDAEYRDIIFSKLNQEFIDEQVQFIKKDAGYRVSKFTFLGEDEMPTEVQFLTRDDRRDGRVGSTAHILFKAESNDEAHTEDDKRRFARQLEAIYQRKSHMKECGQGGQVMINRQSRIQGHQMLQNIEGIYELYAGLE